MALDAALGATGLGPHGATRGPPRVSIVIPTYNRRALVGRAVASALSQTLHDLEVIVVDDGSTDGTLEELLTRFDDPRIRCVRQENQGAAAARNRALDLARGEFVAFLDSDDEYRETFAERQVAALEREPDADMAMADVGYVSDERSRWGSAFERCPPPTGLSAMLDGGWSLLIGWMVRAPVAKELRFASSSFVEDTEFLFRFLADGHRVVVVPEILAEYYLDDQEFETPRKCRSVARVREERLRLQERYADRAGDPVAQRRHLDRAWARHYVKLGRGKEARHHALRWWRARPLSPEAIRYGLRSLLLRS